MFTNTRSPSLAEATPQRLNEATILMIDDEKLNSFVVAEYLKTDGYRDLVHTTDPVSALALANRVRPDVILLDIEMPLLNGLELLEQLRADSALAETPVVVLSATSDQQIKSRAFELKAAGFLQKPIRKDELLSHLRGILA